MRKIFLVLLFSVFVLLTSGARAETFHGYFVTEKGQTQPVDEFLNLYDSFSFRYLANTSKIDFSNIKTIVFLKKNQAIITKKNGKKFKVIADATRLSGEYLKYKYYDLVNERIVKSAIHYDSIKEIGFADDFGDIRKCPVCGRTFFPDYIFCPYDKEKLLLIKVK